MHAGMAKLGETRFGCLAHLAPCLCLVRAVSLSVCLSLGQIQYILLYTPNMRRGSHNLVVRNIMFVGVPRGEAPPVNHSLPKYVPRPVCAQLSRF
jgi:hypothetical protein